MSEVVINRVTARICEQVLLGEIDWTLAAGEHWAVMGPTVRASRLWAACSAVNWRLLREL